MDVKIADSQSQQSPTDDSSVELIPYDESLFARWWHPLVIEHTVATAFLGLGLLYWVFLIKLMALGDEEFSRWVERFWRWVTVPWSADEAGAVLLTLATTFLLHELTHAVLAHELGQPSIYTFTVDATTETAACLAYTRTRYAILLAAPQVFTVGAAVLELVVAPEVAFLLHLFALVNVALGGKDLALYLTYGRSKTETYAIVDARGRVVVIVPDEADREA